MIIGALRKFTLIDYPGKMAAIIFTQGCNFRCPFCFNRELVLEEYFKPPVPEEDVFSFLRRRVGLLEAVVVTGGEPTIHEDLPAFLKKIKELGYLVKLDTNGGHPDMLKKIINDGFVDFIAMDIKAPWDQYERLAGVTVEIEKIKQSMELIAEGKLAHEFRTTVVKDLLKKTNITAITEILKNKGPYHPHPFIWTETVLDHSLSTSK